jgi:hypothetical protein
MIGGGSGGIGWHKLQASGSRLFALHTIAMHEDRLAGRLITDDSF